MSKLKINVEKINVFVAPLLGFFIAIIYPGGNIELLSTLVGIATLVPPAVELFKVHLNLSGKKILGLKAPVFLNFAVSITLVFISHFLQLGFETLTLGGSLFWAIVIALCANGWYKYIELPLAILFERKGKIDELLKIEEIKEALRKAKK